MNRFFTKRHLLLIIGPVLLFAPVLFLGKALVWGTVSTQFIPWWDFSWETILQGQIPLWNPWVGMGAPLVGNYQSAIFYPPYWILLGIYAISGIKAMSWGVTVVVVMHLIWSGLGTAKLLEELDIAPLGQIVGGMAFSLSGYLVARASFLSINAAVSWMPWILFYSLRLNKRKPNAFWSLSLIMAIQLLAGHAQTAWYSILLGGIWMVYLAVGNINRKGKIGEAWKTVSRYILAGLLGAGISAIQLIPTFEYLLQSQRSSDYGYAAAMTYSFWPWRFLTFIVPNLFGTPAAGTYWGYGNFWEDAVYIGLLPLLIALGFVFRSIRNKNKDIRLNCRRNLAIFLAGVVLVSFLLALGDHTFVFPFLYKHIPTFGFFQAPARFSLWAELSLAILAGIGIDQLALVQGKRKYTIRLAAAGCLAIMGGASIGWILLTDVKTTFFIPIGIAGLIGLGTSLLILFQPEQGEDSKYKAWSAFVIMLVAADLVLAGWGLNRGVDIEFYDVARDDDRGTRTFMAGDLEYDLKFNKYFRSETFEPDVPWEHLVQDLLPNTPMLKRIEMVNNFDPIVPARFQVWVDEFDKSGVRNNNRMHYLMNLGRLVSKTGGEVQNLDTGDISREIWIAEQVEIYHDSGEILKRILDPSSDLVNEVILDSSPSALKANCQENGSGVVLINEKKPGYIQIETDLSSNSWLFWSQSWYPGWVAVIDNQDKVEVERANYLFQAICVPAGEHVVEIVYRPFSFMAGGIISALSTSFLIGALINIKRKKAS